MFEPTIRFVFPVVAAVAVLSAPAHARGAIEPQQASRPIDLVIALDVSGSMSALLQSAKQRLWDVINELDRAQPQPDLRVAVLSYGSPRYGKNTGFVRIDMPLTRDLDAVNETLFQLTTSGGSEYVARVIARAREGLQWSEDSDALRIIFVAGNEAANQDPVLSVEQVTRQAARDGIVVNTIFCGRDNGGTVAAGWRQVAAYADGFYASIDQKISAVANVATPYDSRLQELNDALNRTYVPYGDQGRERRENQVRQDSNAQSMSPAAAASRTVTKASSAYKSVEWDLVDAVSAGAPLREVAPNALPAEMRDLDEREREEFIRLRSRERGAIQGEIKKLGEERRAFIARERAASEPSKEAGLADALKQGLQRAAGKKGFSIEK